MLVLPGQAALTATQIKRLIQKLQKVEPHVTHLLARSVYFVESTRPVTAAEAEDLTALLSGPFPTIPQEIEIEKESVATLWILPRIGTLSSWSSKATQIIQLSGWHDVKRIERGCVYELYANDKLFLEKILPLLHDRMTQTVLQEPPTPEMLFGHHEAREITECPVMSQGKSAIIEANKKWGLALNEQEIDYLFSLFTELKRNPTDVELMMFAQANSEHCRHKIFRGNWEIDDKLQSNSLFSMIQHTHKMHPEHTLIAYADNAAVIEGNTAQRFFADPQTHVYHFNHEMAHIIAKVETHNHPTAIAPFAGAATGTGGELRDEAATGRGARSKAGLVGFAVSNLQIPDYKQPWEEEYGYPKNIATSLTIMLEAPLGAARYGNEFGRINLCGYFRTYEQTITVNNKCERRGYHKPIMLAGGLGNIREIHVKKNTVEPGMLLVVLGGPALLIGLGGGAASSMAATDKQAELDFASVQRDNPEMERRCQEVIDACWALGTKNPIVAIHDVGAGGLSNALPELLHDSDRGGKIDLRKIPTADPSLSPLELWCNEAQERYVLAIDAKDLARFTEIAERERCPFAVVGIATKEQDLIIADHNKQNPVELPLPAVLGQMPAQTRKVNTRKIKNSAFSTVIDLNEAIQRVLQLPTVADKTFLITIGDRSIGGLTARDQMIGPWQVPVSDVAVTATDFINYQGEAMAIGERPPIALLDPAASARMAVGEALTNLLAADIVNLNHVKLSANWMAACGMPGEDAALYAAVQAVGEEICPALGISIPVGKDSLSMRMIWKEGEQEKSVVAPLSLNITAFSPVADVRKTLTPLLNSDAEPTYLVFIDLAQHKQRLGGSALTQVYNQLGDVPPNLDNPKVLVKFALVLKQLREQNYVLAYHDRSDGGLFTTIAEMAFATHCGISLNLDKLGQDSIASLFNEELGVVIQVRQKEWSMVEAILKAHDLADFSHIIGAPTIQDEIIISHNKTEIYRASRVELQRLWSKTSYHMQALRDNPECAQQQYEQILDNADPGLSVFLTFDPEQNLAAPYIHKNIKPKIAILREQGVNGQIEMAAAFTLAGFEAVDVHMTDILERGVKLSAFKGLALCGGFSYGDVLGAGRGWATTILRHTETRNAFAEFFQRQDTFTLGVCNGCQAMAYLRELIPGAENWPYFMPNLSEQFEARLVSVKVLESPSILLQGMAGSHLPIAVAHGEGYVQAVTATPGIASLCYVDSYGYPTEKYPANPNGSAQGITGFTTTDGRVTIMMPHPERIFRTVQHSWHPTDWGVDGPWMRMFRNARVWVD